MAMVRRGVMFSFRLDSCWRVEVVKGAAGRVYKTKAGAQDAHEAIRPSNVELTPEQVKKDLTGDQYRLYWLIWNRFVACQMSNAVYDAVSVEIQADVHTFRASSSSLKFSGYTALSTVCCRTPRYPALFPYWP